MKFKPGEIDALDIVAFGIDELRKRGTPEHASAVKIHKAAIKQWKKDFWTRCPKCGSVKGKDV